MASMMRQMESAGFGDSLDERIFSPGRRALASQHASRAATRGRPPRACSALSSRVGWRVNLTASGSPLGRAAWRASSRSLRIVCSTSSSALSFTTSDTSACEASTSRRMSPSRPSSCSISVGIPRSASRFSAGSRSCDAPSRWSHRITSASTAPGTRTLGAGARSRSRPASCSWSTPANA